MHSEDAKCLRHNLLHRQVFNPFFCRGVIIAQPTRPGPDEHVVISHLVTQSLLTRFCTKSMLFRLMQLIEKTGAKSSNVNGGGR